MENREKIVQDYFKMIVLLNRANLIPNQKTEIQFRIVKSPPEVLDFVVQIGSSNRTRSLTLCKSKRLGPWEACNYSDLIFLEEFCASELNDKFKNLNFTLSNFNEKDFADLAAYIHKQLRRLIVPDNIA